MSLTFQSVGKEQVPMVRQLAQALWPDAFAHLLSPAQIAYMMEMMYSEDVLNAELDQQVIYDLLEGEGEAIGFCSYGPVSDSICPLHKLYLLSSKRGGGMGRKAFEHMATYARAQGAHTLRLRVNRGNAGAIRAYQHWGFKVVAEDDKDIGHGFVMDDYIMDFSL